MTTPITAEQFALAARCLHAVEQDERRRRKAVTTAVLWTAWDLALSAWQHEQTQPAQGETL